jgi:hypothetical protein
VFFNIINWKVSWEFVIPPNTVPPKPILFSTPVGTLTLMDWVCKFTVFPVTEGLISLTVSNIFLSVSSSIQYNGDKSFSKRKL